MITYTNEFKTVKECIGAIEKTKLRFSDRFNNVETFDEFTNKCIDIFKEYHVNTDSIYYRPNARFDLNINKYGTTIAFDNKTAFSIDILETGYKVSIIFFMPEDKVIRSNEGKKLVDSGFLISSRKPYDKNLKPKKEKYLESLQSGEMTEEQRINLERNLINKGLIN